MDAMALLCMLHADGPATLKSLRQAGCSSLEAIESMGEERLSRLLGSPAAAARRFAREARLLRERLGQGMLDREESTIAGAEAIQPGAEAIQPGAAAVQPVESVRADAVEEALAAWRARDFEELEIEEAPSVTVAVAGIREIAEPAESVPAAVVPGLTAGVIDGLDQGLCRKLAEIEVRTLSDLALADPLDLSRASGLGYTHVWRLICLSRRALSTGREDFAKTERLPAVDLIPHKVSLAEVPRQEEPSILELEWNREIRPTSPPPRRAAADVQKSDSERESAGGPFA